MADVLFRAGRYYTIAELAELARRGLEELSLTHAQAAAILNERVEKKRGQYHRPHVTGALTNPERFPGMVLLLVEMFTPYATDQTPRYLLERQE